MRKTGFEYDDREEEEESVYVYKIQVLGRVVLLEHLICSDWIN